MRGEDRPEVAREQWGSHLEFILCAVGYCIGFGNIWRFPYRAFANGGGAFLVPYALMLALVGIPFFFIEQSIAQFSSKGPISLWDMCPLFKGIGYATFVINYLTAVYYNVLLGWVVYYLVHSFTLHLPWGACDNPWNTHQCDHVLRQCITKGGFVDGYVCRSEQTEYEQLFMRDDNSWTSSSEEFWLNRVLHKSDSIGDTGGILWPQYSAFILAQTIVYLILIKGVKSSGKVVYFTATAPFVLLFILLVRGLTLPGMAEGVKFFIQPDFAKLGDSNVWGSAANQIVYSLGLGFGGTPTMSSFKAFNTNSERDTFIVSLANSGTSVFAGFTVFSILGYLAFKLQTSVGDAIRDGMGLAFIAYPDVVLQMPGSPIWAVLFFFMMINIGLDSVFTGIEAFTTPLCDEFPALEPHKRQVTALCLVSLTLLALPIFTSSGIYWFTILDWYTAWYSLFLLEITQGVVVAYVYGVRRFAVDLETMIGHAPSNIWKLFWLVLSPFTLFCVLLINIVGYTTVSLGDYQYPAWGGAFGWAIMIAGYSPIPLYAIYKVWITPGESVTERICINLRPTKDWGPRNPQDRKRNNDLIVKKLGRNYLTDGSNYMYS